MLNDSSLTEYVDMASFPIDLVKASLSTIVQGLDDGLFTSEQLVQVYIS